MPCLNLPREILLAEWWGWGGGEGMEFVFQKHYTGKKETQHFTDA